MARFDGLQRLRPDLTDVSDDGIRHLAACEPPQKLDLETSAMETRKQVRKQEWETSATGKQVPCTGSPRRVSATSGQLLWPHTAANDNLHSTVSSPW